MQASITCVLGLVTCLLNQSNVAVSAGQELLFGTAGFECLKHHKVGIFVEKDNSQRSLLSGIRSLQGNTIFRRVELTSTEEQLTKLFTSDQSRFQV